MSSFSRLRTGSSSPLRACSVMRFSRLMPSNKLINLNDR
ncbi:Uncharacterised protein [Vibrio cholerae]|nr:Uncharacterised protein [Vibrio cholerae]